MSETADAPAALTPAAAAQARAARLATLPLREAGPRGGFFTGPIHALRSILQHRELLDLLIRRELKSRYKDSALGFLWSLARPLTQLLIYWLVLGQFLGAARNINNFAIYIFAGLTIYGLFSEVIMVMTASIVANSGLVKKVYLPREIFPLATVGSSLFNFGVQMLILVAAALVLRTITFGTDLLYFPLALAVALVYAVAIGLALAALNVSMRDVQYIVEIVVLLLMWFSPIVYSWTFVGDALANMGAPSWLADVYLASPLTLAVLGFQKAFWGTASGGVFPEHLAANLGIALVIGLALVWLAQRLFSKMEGNFAQEL